MLSLGNIYFNNLNTPNKYSKHLQHAADFYRRILQKDPANAYAANGLGTVLAEKGELFKAKEIFNRVREVSGDTLSDSLLNLGHIYLAQKKHPEALQMYQNYMSRTRSSAGAQTTSKSQEDDEAEVLLYIAFAYFDWAREAELFNNAKAAPADERYQKCIHYIESAMKKSKRENCVLRYNWCLAKLQAANCTLQKVNRNIRRTAQEVKDALDGLVESLPILQTILQWKEEGRKVAISKGMLSGVVNQCKHNIDSAKSHLKEELKNEQDAERLRHFQRTEAEINEKQRALAVSLQKEKEAQEIEESELRARKKMERVNNLLDGWKKAEAAAKKESTQKSKKDKGDAPPGGVDDEAGVFDTDVNPNDNTALFDDSDDEDDEDEAEISDKANEPGSTPGGRDKELFGDSSSDEEEEFTKKRSNSDGDDDEKVIKKRKLEDREELEAH
jgi:RNA polymerase-associated protein CTR9